MRIAVSADIHGTKFLSMLEESLSKLMDVDLLLLAGDLVLKNETGHVGLVLSTVRRVYEGSILACFGNEEYEQSKHEYLRFSEIRWLDDESCRLRFDNRELAIIGSRGSLDRPTFWQRTHVKGIWKTYAERVKRVERLLETAGDADVTIVLTHYTPTYETLEGEGERYWPEMGCKRMEEVIKRTKPNIWFHGHAHRGTRFESRIDETRVLNVSLPARREIVLIDLENIWG
ncbi:MAG: metallophosphoesterase [Candidatus Geothermarchaeales archaeon]